MGLIWGDIIHVKSALASKIIDHLSPVTDNGRIARRTTGLTSLTTSLNISIGKYQGNGWQTLHTLPSYPRYSHHFDHF